VSELIIAIAVASGLALIGLANLLVAGVIAFALRRMLPMLDLLSKTLLTMQMEYSLVRNHLEDLWKLFAGMPLDELIFPRYIDRAKQRERGGGDHAG
jgi:hypothetical protein